MTVFPFTAKAILVEQPLYRFYAVVIPAKVLLEVAFSDAMQATLKPTGDGYTVDATQRVIQSKRLAQISGYIDREDSGFPNTIILAANYRQDGLSEEDESGDDIQGEPVQSRRWQVVEDECGGYTITIPTPAKLAAVIDGQHRLFAFAESKRPDRLDMNLLCSVFLDLPKPYQAQLFATINSTQKPVDKSLTYELFGYNIDEEEPPFWSPDKLAVFLTRKLGTEPSSPLSGRIIIAPQKDASLERIAATGVWKVSTAVVVEGILRLFSSNPKRDTQLLLTPTRQSRRVLEKGPRDRSPLRQYYIESNDNLIYTLVLNYLTACENIFWSEAATASFITRTVGVQALLDVLRRSLVVPALAKKDISVGFFTQYLSKAAHLDFSEEVYQKASGSGRTVIRKALDQAIGLT